MDAFGIMLLLMTFIEASGVLGVLVAVFACSLVIVVLLTAALFLSDVADAARARLYENPEQKAERLRLKREARERRRERLRHPLSF